MVEVTAGASSRVSGEERRGRTAGQRREVSRAGVRRGTSQGVGQADQRLIDGAGEDAVSTADVGDRDAAAGGISRERGVPIRAGAEVAREPGDVSAGRVRPEGTNSGHKPRVVKEAGVTEARDAEQLAPEAEALGAAEGGPEVSGRAHIGEVSSGLDTLDEEASAGEAGGQGLAGGGQEGGEGGAAGDGEAVQERGQGVRHSA